MPEAAPTPTPTPTEHEPTEAKPRGRKVARHYTPSQKAEVVEYARKHGVTAAHKQLGASRHSIYAWQREAEAAAAGETQASTTTTPATDVSVRVTAS